MVLGLCRWQKAAVSSFKIKGTGLVLLTKTHVKREPCKRCKIVRLYLMFVIAIALIALMAGDKLHPLGAIGPEFFGWFFAGLAVCLFIVKFLFWYLKRQDKPTRTS